MRAARPLLAPVLAGAGVLALVGCGGARPTRSAVLDASVSLATGNPIAVSPLPGTPDASPSTQISFLGPRGTRVRGLSVVASVSGPHRGALRAYSTGTGQSFLPSRPFLPGESVSVDARVSVGGRVRRAYTTFTVARAAAVEESEFPPEPGDPQAVQHYASAPALTPSTVTIATPPQPGAAPGDLFLAPYQGDGAPGPMIVDQRGELVWFHPLPPEQTASSFAVQRYEGRPALTWWQGRILQLGFGQGEDVIYDSSYRKVAGVRAGNGYSADLHAFRLSSHGTAWIDAFYPVHLDLSAAGGIREGIVSDSVVQEIDVRTGLVMWEWHALGHIPASDSQAPPEHSSYPWDYAHVNSIFPGQRGDVLISARSACAVYDVDIRTGAVRWRLGGPHSSFRLPAAARFYWQHDAELQPGGLMSLFDNGSDPPKERQSRALVLALDERTRSASLVAQLADPARTLLAPSQGNAQALPGGSWLLGYGRLPSFAELDRAGHLLLEGSLGRGVQSFQTTLSPWRGRPVSPPALVSSPRAGGGISLAVSWNGATEVSSWRVLEGSFPNALRPVASAPRRGFETTIPAPAAPYVAAQARDGAGAVIGTSLAVAG